MKYRSFADNFTQLYHYDSPLMLSGKLVQIAKASGTNAKTGGILSLYSYTVKICPGTFDAKT